MAASILGDSLHYPRLVVRLPEAPEDRAGLPSGERRAHARLGIVHRVYRVWRSVVACVIRAPRKICFLVLRREQTDVSRLVN